MNRRSWFTILICGLFWAGSAEGAAWSQKEGHYYAKVSGIFYSADELFDGGGNRHSNPLNETFNSAQAFVYVEYGLRDRLTVIGATSGGRLKSKIGQTSLSTSALSDLDIGAKFQLTDGPVVIAPYVKFKVPTGYNEAAVPAVGTGDVDFEARLLASGSFYPVPVYVGTELGMRVRSGRFSNQVPYVLEIGATPSPKLFLKVVLDGVNTLIGSGGNLGAMGSMSMQVSEGDFTKVGFNAAFNVTGKVWIDATYDTIFRGKNVGAGRAFGIGLSISY